MFYLFLIYIRINKKLNEEKILESYKDCTFRPKINKNYKRDNIYQIDNSNSIERFESLYKLGTQSIIHKRNKTNEDFDIEKYGEECTFKPILNEYNSVILQRNELNMDKDIEKYVERMKIGRIVNKLF